ncbi:ATP-dependent Clp protease ATP-binding subunit [Pseudoflavonifractor sp. 60]|uniref:ATP-dependent Clp protease ATP-binding subunit n=1 Tax=Pseudoflavonifractor sp. 60 TaxID=2304576 RepID=UPI001371CCB6|nr:ATP-dependent Clp protease ATP-binding subunit [Pseudoflavonifractor sp. 60]NBI66625.1 ATP-dependent Clp protease ATP-binding subunit [Pseudoflavonifractor sp. 60]
MQPTMCSRCGKNVAVIFITKLEGSASKNEGLCLKCAREMGIKPIDDMMKRMGISDEDLDNLTSEMMSAFGGAEGIEGMMSPAKEEDDEEDDGRTATFPFLNQLFGGGSSSPAPAPSGEGPAPSSREKNSGAKPAKRKFLDSYCISLTQRAQDGKLDQLIGRERELERVIQILNRRQKNNPCLIGEPGVGKTAIAEGLAQRIAAKDVPYKLLDKEVYLLDLTALVAGTQFRGQFESRMKGLIEEIRKLGNIILVIDEVHTIVGAGDAEGSMNAANILKPALSRGEIQVIGATTLNEYRKHIEKDTALERRFQPVIVEEPSIEESVRVIEGIVPYYEKFHQVTVSPAMCRLAVTMSERYITDRYLPDKAIDLIDEACSNVNLHNKALARLNAVDKELADLAKEKEVMMAAATEDSYKRLADIKSLELRLEEEKQGLEAQAHPALAQEHLANVIELWTNIPASRIQEQEFQRLARLEERLKEHVIGQDEAVKAVSVAIRRGRVGISPKRKPVSFIFVGSTGVGKTELVKQLAADLFDTPESLIRLDMSEFMEKHAVSRIIGSPPGYVGYDEAGQLTEKIRRKPYSVVLFDEIEKAHPDVLNILLQVLDDGRITDAHGRTVNFENTVIVMTTNAGSSTKVGSVGFGRTANEQGKDRAMKALNDFLRPEFINRIDEIVYFNQLSEENFKDIAVLMLKELVGTLGEKDIHFTWDETLLDYLVKKSYSATYGARNLRRLIQKELEDTIAARLIEGWQEPVSQLKAVSDGETLELLAM